MTDYGDILADGKWVADKHGIQRWVADAPDTPPLACDFCNATTAEPCRTSAGTTRTPHAERIMRCLCGSNVEPGRTYCDDCQGVARRTAWRDSKRRKRVPVITNCVCGTRLPTPEGKGRPSIFCSDECRRDARRASWRTYSEKRKHVPTPGYPDIKPDSELIGRKRRKDAEADAYHHDTKTGAA